MMIVADGGGCDDDSDRWWCGVSDDSDRGGRCCDE